jgi:mannose-6-phosphate isomerase-like protein (cupin superfamily)
MIIRDIKNCDYFRAMDKTLLCELLHPDKENEDLKIDFSIAHAVLKCGESSIVHRLKTSVEIYYILQGKGIMHIGDEAEEIHPGQVIYIPANSNQYIENTGNEELKFLCIVNPMWKEEDEEIVKYSKKHVETREN